MIRHIFLTLALLFSVVTAQAQERNNKIVVPDAVVAPGSNQLAVEIVNSDEIVAAQFDLTLPEGIAAQAEATVTNRGDGHVATVRSLGGGSYRVLLYSPRNRALRGQQGTAFYLPITVTEKAQDGTNYPLGIARALLTTASGENVLTGVEAGSIAVQKRPDLTVGSIVVTQQRLSPGERLVASWQVHNIGELPTGSGWSEQLALVSASGSVSRHIATLYCDETLQAGGVVSRQAEVELPSQLGIDGDARLQICVVPDKDTGEPASAQANNTAVGDATLYINKVLTFTLSPQRVVEGETKEIKAKVYRSGRNTEAETFSMTTSIDDPRLKTPSAVTIPAGQSGAVFSMAVIDNDELDADSVASIGIEVAGNGYDTVGQTLLIEDDEWPRLTLTASKSVVEEGETLQLTVATERAQEQPIVVALHCEDGTRFTMPRSVTIEPGHTSATVSLTAVDDEVPGQDATYAVYASAHRHTAGQTLLMVLDNDMPVLELTLTPNRVREGAGTMAVAALLRRTTNTDKKITVKLTDDANGGLHFANRTLELSKGMAEKYFNLGPVDNALVDGDRTYTVTASVWLSSCSCSAAGEQAGSVQAQLQVTDDDGPALTLAATVATVKEGGQTTLTISRNTDTAQPLTVTLSSDADEALTYDHTVTIPAGQTTAQVVVTSAKNDVAADSRTVTFAAEASGHATGLCALMITDQTLPDASIGSIETDTDEIEVGGSVTIRVEITNNGAAELPEGVAVRIYRRGETNAVATLYTQAAIAAQGGRLTLSRNLRLPDKVGICYYFAVVNETNEMKELCYTNNTSVEVPIKVVSPYTAQVTTNKSVYKQGEKVLISGSLFGKSVAGVPVDVYIINDGVRQVLTATTDVQGTFAAEWQPYSLQSGHFSVGACFPGEGLSTEMATFDIYGLKRVDTGFVTCDVVNGHPHSGTIALVNPGVLGLTGVWAEVVKRPDNCELSVSMPNTIGAGQTVSLSYKLTGTTPSARNDWDQIVVRVHTAEGVVHDVTLYFYCRAARARLVTGVQRINTTMVKGQSRDYAISLSNHGQGSTGKITLSLPGWMKSLSGTVLASLEQGESVTIGLQLSPTDDMQLNVPVTGQIGINCEHGDGVSVGYSFTPVSETMGKLVVDVCDEYTYATEEAPHVEGAQVVLRNPVTGALVAQGLTDESGIFTIDLPEGYYSLSVAADGHESYKNNILVAPNVQTREVVNISIQAITIDWRVEETETEDRYELVQIVKYETNVPVPVVLLSGPQKVDGDAMQPGDQTLLHFTLTNKGLVTAENTVLYLPKSNGEWQMKALSSTGPFKLAPGQSVVVPVILQKLSDKEHIQSSRKKTSDGAIRDGAESFALTFTSCMANMAHEYEYMCGDNLKNNRILENLALSSCSLGAALSGLQTFLSSIGAGNGGLTPKYGPSKPNEDSKDKVSATSDSKGVGLEKSMTFCDPNDVACANELISGLLGCSEGLAQAGIDNITKFSSSLQDYRDRRDRAINENVSMEEAEKNYLKEIVVGGIQQCNDILKAAEEKLQISAIAVLDDEDDGIMGKTLSSLATISNKIFNIAMACESTYNKLHPRDVQGYGDKLQTFYDCVHLYENTESIVKAIFTKEEWIEKLQTDVDALCVYLLGVDLLNTPIEEIIANRPNSVTEEACREISEKIIATVKYYHFVAEEIDHNLHKVARSIDTTGTSIIDIDRIIASGQAIHALEEKAMEAGHGSMSEWFIDDYKAYLDYYDDPSEHVCAKLTLKLSQSMVMTRQAFRGTLTVYNGHEEASMTNAKLQMKVTNLENGSLATQHEFQINLETLKGFNGNPDMESGWELGAQQTGTATTLFIPTKYAAPEEPARYSFGGTLSYIDPFTGLEVTRELYPVTLTVNPSPVLDLDYFVQRDVYGDDPLTEEVEPMQPAEFALLINNKGYGDATNVRMATQQPEITENEKGLLIGFELTSSQINGDDAHLAFGESIINDFGTIPAHSQTYAQWWLQSTLLGHFTDYDVSVNHVTSYGNEQLSLIDNASVHELIHGFTAKADGDKPLRGFLVNDIADSEDMPDEVYFTDATQQGVSMATGKLAVAQGENNFLLTVSAADGGWSYGSLTDPTRGRKKLAGVRRQSDGAAMPLDNFWQTDRTLRDGKDWLYENRMHFVAHLPAGQESYLLTFDPKPELELAVEGFGGTPADGKASSEPITELTVRFNKPIKAETFTGDDITLSCQGAAQDASTITVEPLTDQEFRLVLAEATQKNGYYVLTVQTANIEDMEGFPGALGKQVSWTQFADGKVMLRVNTLPVNGGSVTPESGVYNYDSDVILTATPAEGYEFTKWMAGSNTIDVKPTLAYHLLAETELTAVFAPKHYTVTISYDDRMGVVTGAATGIYDYGTVVSLSAMATEGYRFDGWQQDGVMISEEDTLTLTVKAATEIVGLFSEMPSAKLSGIVKSASTNYPIANATVSLTCDDIVYAAHTDTQGYYEIEVADKTLTYDVKCQADGFIDGPAIKFDLTSGNSTRNFFLLAGATVVLSGDGVCTFAAPVALDLSSADGKVKAYYAISCSGESIRLEEAPYNVAENEGLILVGTPNERIDFNASSPTTEIADNLLTGTAFEPYTVKESNVYVLSSKTGELGFHKATMGQIIPKRKAYLQIDVDNDASLLHLIWSEGTLIEMIKSGNLSRQEQYVDLLGRPIDRNKNDRKRIHIKGGKKFIHR